MGRPGHTYRHKDSNLDLRVLSATPLPVGLWRQENPYARRDSNPHLRLLGPVPLPIGLRASKSRHPVPTRASRLTKAGSQAVCGGGAPRQGFEPRSRDPESRVFPTRRPGNSTSARTRTWGLPLRKRALSPLSYRGMTRHTDAARNQRAVELSIHMPSPKRKGTAWAAGVEPAFRRCWRPAAYPLAHPQERPPGTLSSGGL
jgi:hypothetical protein